MLVNSRQHVAVKQSPVIPSLHLPFYLVCEVIALNHVCP